MQRDDAFGSDLDRLGPELEFGTNGAMKHKVLRVGVERTDGRVMTDLLADHAVTQLLPSHNTTHAQHLAVTAVITRSYLVSLQLQSD